MRLDVYLHEQRGVKSRALATKLVQSGAVRVRGDVITQPSKKIPSADMSVLEHEIVIKEHADMLRYVSRAGLKLEHGLQQATKFNISPQDAICLDIGSSTGGFTDCLLQHGATAVMAVDVGTEQLDPSLRQDARVHVFEQTDIRNFSVADAGYTAVDMIVVDVSFISLEMIIPEVCRLGKKDHTAVILLIKPQFEAGKNMLNKKGIVTDPLVHQTICRHISDLCQEAGMHVHEIIESSLRGGDGNVEYLLIARL
jgi:23S rRNA (cytidine1920-2'-O)/16S rRNA (cytidine1409-2'-O)-methyltransferase